MKITALKTQDASYTSLKNSIHPLNQLVDEKFPTFHWWYYHLIIYVYSLCWELWSLLATLLIFKDTLGKSLQLNHLLQKEEVCLFLSTSFLAPLSRGTKILILWPLIHVEGSVHVKSLYIYFSVVSHLRGYLFFLPFVPPYLPYIPTYELLINVFHFYPSWWHIGQQWKCHL